MAKVVREVVAAGLTLLEGQGPMRREWETEVRKQHQREGCPRRFQSRQRGSKNKCVWGSLRGAYSQTLKVKKETCASPSRGERYGRVVKNLCFESDQFGVKYMLPNLHDLG